MNALGWQIGAVLIGISSLVTAIYISKTFNEFSKTVTKLNNMIDYNQRNINEILDNTAKVTKSLSEMMSFMDKVFAVLKMFKIFKK